ncbi:MAG: TIGR02996 domain-containing protein [Planctomycetales bacterium]
MRLKFIREILANPIDPAPRLVYGDWLEERGDDKKAAFFRDKNFDVKGLYTLVVEEFGEGDGSGHGLGYGYKNGDGIGYGLMYFRDDTLTENRINRGDGYGQGYGDINGGGLGMGVGGNDNGDGNLHDFCNDNRRHHVGGYGKLKVLGADEDQSADGKP